MIDSQTTSSMDEYLNRAPYNKMYLTTLYKFFRDNDKWSLIGDYIIFVHIIRIMKEHGKLYSRGQLLRTWRMIEEGKKDKQLPKEFDEYINLKKRKMSEAQEAWVGEFKKKSFAGRKKVSQRVSRGDKKPKK